MSTSTIGVTPLHDRLLVHRLIEDEKTAGGIIIPDSAKEKPSKGKVVAVGTGRTNDEGKTTPLAVKTGDNVLFSKYSGTEFKLDGKEYLMIREDDVLGILN